MSECSELDLSTQSILVGAGTGENVQGSTLEPDEIEQLECGPQLRTVLKRLPQNAAEIIEAVAAERSLWQEQNADSTANAITKILQENPALRFMLPMFMNKEEGLSGKELLQHFLEVIENYKSLINPFDEDLKGNPEGSIDVNKIKVAVVATDIRNFTDFTQRFESDAFDYLRLGYFCMILPIIKKYNMKIVNNGGDALMLYCHDVTDENGTTIRTAVENAMLFSVELNYWTNVIAQEFRDKLHLAAIDSNYFKTGIGIDYGSLEMGNAFEESPGNIGAIETIRQSVFRRMEKECKEDEIAILKRRFHQEIMMIFLGKVLNRAARLQALHKDWRKLLVKKDDDAHKDSIEAEGAGTERPSEGRNIFISDRAISHARAEVSGHFDVLGTIPLSGIGLSTVLSMRGDGTVRSLKIS